MMSALLAWVRLLLFTIVSRCERIQLRDPSPGLLGKMSSEGRKESLEKREIKFLEEFLQMYINFQK